ncbi:MAG: hypothetical protein ACYCWW_11800 [Deltaproteobacteria bacterium]
MPALSLLALSFALGHRQAGLICLSPPSPSPASSGVPTNALLFDFNATELQDSSGGLVPLFQPGAPWDDDARYRAAELPLQPNATYLLPFAPGGAPSTGSFTTGSGPDTTPPSAPAVLGAIPGDGNDFAYGCFSDRLELLPLVPSEDDATPASELRYEVSEQLPDGGLARVYEELVPVGLPDGGSVLPLPMGLSGLPGSYVVQARDWAGNLSPPSAPVRITVGPSCDFAESTAGGAPPSLLALWLLGLGFLARRRRR